MTYDEQLHYDEMKAAVEHLRQELQAAECELGRKKQLAPKAVRAANTKLKNDNAKLRERITGKRRRFPADVFRFGMYFGKPISKAKSDYLRWVIANVSNVTPEFQRRMIDELTRRGAPLLGLVPAKPMRKKRKTSKLTADQACRSG